ncbi:MAG TPA: hypothetical protein PLK75_09265 [Bacteroidales bacterium]|nr:hypothetical protein [Bacteroidales bacterium]
MLSVTARRSTCAEPVEIQIASCSYLTFAKTGSFVFVTVNPEGLPDSYLIGINFSSVFDKKNEDR